MTRISRLALITSCSLALGACSHIGIASPKLFQPAASQPEQTAAPISARVWPQTASDIAPDPNVRFGTLANGMRYALLKNATPTGQAAIRLRFDAGSLMETDAQQGLAHFLEHMAFNGSKNVAEGEMVKILERHGLSFGADTNASTDFTQTIYKLDLPKTDDDTVDTSLMLMRETASELTISQEAVDRERGILLSEERSRDSPGFRVFKQSFSFFLKDQLAPRRLPIGQAEVLKTASRDLIADFYSKYYRPERAVLVVVGDFDLDAMEGKIKARFGDWQTTAPVGPEPDMGKLANRDLEAKIAVEPGSRTSIQYGWQRPVDLSADRIAKRRDDLIWSLGLAVVNRRLERLARGENPAFIGAVVYTNNEVNSAERTTVSVNVEPDKWRDGLTVTQAEIKRAVAFGVLQTELDREIAEYRANLVALAARAETRRTTALANELIGSVDDRSVVTSPAQDLAMFEQSVQGLSAETVSTTLKRAFIGQGPLIFMSSPDPIVGGDKVLLETFKAADAQKVTPPVQEAAVTWPYSQFGPIGTVAERKDIADLDTVFIRFANGVRLTVKQTKFTQDQILVRARLGNGKLDLPKDRATASWMPGWAATEGGLKALTNEQIEKVLTGRIYGLDLSLDDDALELNGATRPADLDTQLQLMAAYVQEPGWRTQGFERAKTLYIPFNAQLDATPGGVLQREIEALLHSGDRRWAFPTKDQISATKADELKQVLEPSLTDGPAEIIIVGDITVDKAIEAVAATFGALPARPERAPVKTGWDVQFPAGTPQPVILTHKGRADQASAFIAWPSQDFVADPQEARTLRVLAQIIELRMTDELREKQGATYSPSASADASMIYPGYGYIAASVEMPPAKLEGFFSDMDKIAADLRDQPVSADELQRAKTPQLDSLEKARQTNGYWLNILSGAQTEDLRPYPANVMIRALANTQPRSVRLDAARSVMASLAKVTAADLQKAAKTYLKPDKAWRLKVVPETK
jgi:zinc protease